MLPRRGEGGTLLSKAWERCGRIPSVVVGVCTVQLDLPAVRSLKEKRGILKPLLHQVRREFNVSVAEVDANDLWKSAVLGISCVSSSREYAHGLLSKVVKQIETGRLDARIVDYQIEIF